MKIRSVRDSGSSHCEGMSFLRHREIYQSDELGLRGRNRIRVTPSLIVLMSLRLVIPGGLLFSIARFRFTSRSECATGRDRIQVEASFARHTGGPRHEPGA
jgi:hypothetical protein